MKKNVLGTKFKMVDGEKQPWESNLISENIHGHYRNKNDLKKPQNHGFILPFTEQYQKRIFGYGEMRKTTEIMKENAQQAPSV